MDPKETLRMIDQAISDLRFIDARIHLSDYWRWRTHGGFEPVEVVGSTQRGDPFARECRRRLNDATRDIKYTCTMRSDAMSASLTDVASLDEALDYVERYLSKLVNDDAKDDIYCEDTLGNSWNLARGDDGKHFWTPADVMDAIYPIHELPVRVFT